MTQKLGFLKVLEASMFAVIDFHSEGGKIQYIDLCKYLPSSYSTLLFLVLQMPTIFQILLKVARVTFINLRKMMYLTQSRAPLAWV